MKRKKVANYILPCNY